MEHVYSELQSERRRGEHQTTDWGRRARTLLPWWRGFKGTTKKTGEHKYDVTGIANKVNDTTIEVISPHISVEH